MPLNDIHLPRQVGKSLYWRLRQLIVNEMPSGSHLERAEAWDALAARCTRAAQLHREAATALEPDEWYAAEVERLKDRGPA
jgi:hypothetical protein